MTVQIRFHRHSDIPEFGRQMRRVGDERGTQPGKSARILQRVFRGQESRVDGGFGIEGALVVVNLVVVGR